MCGRSARMSADTSLNMLSYLFGGWDTKGRVGMQPPAVLWKAHGQSLVLSFEEKVLSYCISSSPWVGMPGRHPNP